PWALRDERGDAADWNVVGDFSIQPKGNNMLVCFENCNSRDDADKYVNKLIGVPREVLPALDEQEHYWVDLLGVEVVNLESEHLGEVHDVAWNGAHPVLLVRDETEQDLMIPFIPEYVQKVDSRSKITVSWSRDWV
ncbi:MAG: 16S rRNA processing protein RimM, partial [Gammaproteobacteria bacterium]|nr:16S rRNA processing protein RimM [Gammaproteobacteria bacterium]